MVLATATGDNDPPPHGNSGAPSRASAAASFMISIAMSDNGTTCG
jgi:hypothetical protein